MVEAAGVTLRDSIEAILVIFVMVAFLSRTKQIAKKKFIYGGALIAVGLSIALAVILSQIGMNPENEFVEGILFFVAAILVGSLTVWMMRHAKHFKSEIERQMQKTSSGLMLGFIAFVMVFREGAEIVIFMQSLLLAGSTPVQNFLGGLIGLGLAVLFGYVFLHGSTKINMSRFFKVTSIILAILVVELIANGFHEFFEIGLIPSTEGLMRVIGFLAKDSTGASIIGLMLLSLILMVAYDLLKTSPPDFSDLNPAQQRKQRYDFLKEKYTKLSMAGLVVVLSIPLLTPTITASDVAMPKPVEVEANDGMISVATPSVDGMYKYKYNDLQFFVVRQNNEVRAALDYCYICPPTGYGYDGDQLVCENCSAPIGIETVGNPGGCNPRVIEYTTATDSMTFSVDNLRTAWGK